VRVAVKVMCGVRARSWWCSCSCGGRVSVRAGAWWSIGLDFRELYVAELLDLRAVWLRRDKMRWSERGRMVRLSCDDATVKRRATTRKFHHDSVTA
jgi:hypothetical protein